MKYYKKIFVIFVLITSFMLAFKFYFEYNRLEVLKYKIIKTDINIITSMIKAFRQTYQDIFIKNHIKIDNKTINLLPAKAMSDISTQLSKILNNKIKIKIISTTPLNINNKANTYEMKIIDFFKDKKKKYYLEDLGNKTFYYAKPLYIKQSCLKCHGNKRDIPKVIQNNYQNIPEYKLGDLRGLLGIEISKKDIINEIKDNYIENSKIVIIVYILLLLIIYIAILIIINNEDKFTYKFKKQIEKEVLKNNEIKELYLKLKKHDDKIKYLNKDLEIKIKTQTNELINEKEYSETIIDSNSRAIIAIDWTGKITTYNTKAQEIFGWTKDEMIGTRNLLNIIPDKYKDLHIRASTNYLKTGKSVGILGNTHELEAIRKNGETFPISISFGSKYKIKGAIVIANIEDITHKKEQEKLINQQSKMVSMGEMIGNIAHQWRQPLSVISMSATGIIMQKEYNILDDEKLIEYCTMIDKNAQYLSKTIDDFKNFIKGNTKKEVFNLKKNIDSFLTLTEGVIKNHNINMIINIDEHIEINGYANELTQCIINIFNNSKDVLNEKNTQDKFIFISAKIIDKNLILSIKDNGGGIDENIIDKIFEPYFTTKHQSQGTGLGLNMTYNLIVDGMKGQIKVENSLYIHEDIEYKGANFIITLPIS